MCAHVCACAPNKYPLNSSLHVCVYKHKCAHVVSTHTYTNTETGRQRAIETKRGTETDRQRCGDRDGDRSDRQRDGDRETEMDYRERRWRQKDRDGEMRKS